MHTDRVSRRGWLLFGALSVLWGIPYLLIKVAVEVLEPATLVFARTALAGLALLPIALRGGHLRGLWAKWPWVLLFALAEIAGPWILLGYAEQQLSSSLTALLLATIPSVALIGARLVGIERQIRGRRWAGLALGLCGVAAIAGLDLGAGDLWAGVAVLFVAIGYATAPLVVTLKLGGASGIGVTTAAMLINAVLYLPYAVWRHPPVSAVPGKVWLSVVLLGLLCGAVAFIVFFALVGEVGPARTSVITYLNPVVAAFAGVLVLGESVTAGLLVGFPLVLLGSVLATSRSRPAAEEGEPPSGQGDQRPVTRSADPAASDPRPG